MGYNQSKREDEEMNGQVIEKVCKICGKEFIANCKKTKCCSEECKKENAKINQKLWADRQKELKAKKKKEKKFTVAELAVKARELGMSYGQYTAMLYAQEGKVQGEG